MDTSKHRLETRADVQNPNLFSVPSMLLTVVAIQINEIMLNTRTGLFVDACGFLLRCLGSRKGFHVDDYGMEGILVALLVCMPSFIRNTLPMKH
jgi:hypothetical protein